MKIENITNINDAMEKLWEYDQDHQKINFPRDKPNYEKFRESIIKEYNEEPKGFFFVYEDNNIIGYLRLITRFNPYRQQKYGDVRFVHLDGLNRGKGYGTKLLEFADEYFKKNGCKYSVWKEFKQNTFPVISFCQFLDCFFAIYPNSNQNQCEYNQISSIDVIPSLGILWK